MTATKYWSAALLLAGACACPAHAQQMVWCAPALQRPLGVAPDAIGPGFYWGNQYGMYYGPSYWLYPPFPPEGGITYDQIMSGKHPTIPGSKGGSKPGGSGPGNGMGGPGPGGGPGGGQGYPYGNPNGHPYQQGYGQGMNPPHAPSPYGMMPPGAPGYGMPPGAPHAPYPGMAPGAPHAPYPGMAPGAPHAPYPGMAPGAPHAPYPGMPPGAPYPPNLPYVGTPGSLPTLPMPPSLPNPGPPYQQAQKQPVFVSHPWTRSPRDFFMWNEVVEDQAKKFPLPTGVQ